MQIICREHIMTNEIPKAPIRRIFKDSISTENRISPSAIIAASQGVQDILTSIAVNSEKLAKHAGRKTIIDDDVNHALSFFLHR